MKKPIKKAKGIPINVRSGYTATPVVCTPVVTDARRSAGLKLPKKFIRSSYFYAIVEIETVNVPCAPTC